MKQISLTVLCVLLGCLAYATRVERTYILFDPNSHDLTEEATDALHALIPRDDCCIIEKVDIEGHCDHRGSADYNLALSKKRAFSVYGYLATLFPDKGDYEIRYVGELHPVSLQADDQNRCVVVTVYLLEKDLMAAPASSADLFPEEFVTPKAIAPVQIETEIHSIRPTLTYIPENVEENTVFQIEDIYFHGNSSTYKSESQESLNELLAFLSYYPAINIRIDGHVNGRMGSRFLKQSGKSNPEKRTYKNGTELSLARAESVMSFLIDNGIDASRISCEGKGGRERLYKKPKNQKENAANRRIEVVILNN